MRYLIQFVVPALILIAVIAMVSRSRRQGDDDGRGIFLVLLVIGAVAAAAILFAIQGYLD